MAPSTKYRGHLTLTSVADPLEITPEDVHEQEIERLLQRISDMTEQELNEGVAVSYDFNLCALCQKHFIKEFIKEYLDDQHHRVTTTIEGPLH